jgi:hypothetical protein
MSQESVERFLGRVITDDRFRERAKTTLEQSCFIEGYLLSKVESAYLTKLDFELLGAVATTLDDAIRRN